MAYLEKLLPEFRKGAKIRCYDWIDGFYIQKDGQTVIDHNNRTFHIHAEDTLSDRWELYQETEPDWDYIIKNKCLCWFWDNESNIPQSANCLKEIRKDLTYSFITNSEHGWKYCRPVRKDEIMFYEDRIDE